MNRLKTDVLVVGGGAAGIRAAVQAAISGVDVILVEESGDRVKDLVDYGVPFKKCIVFLYRLVCKMLVNH